MLDLAERERYDVLVTTDQSIRHQQNLTDRRIGVVVLLANAWPAVRLRTREISEAIATVRPGEVVENSGPPAGYGGFGWPVFR